MRDLIEKLLQMGYSIAFSEEKTYPVIRLYKGEDHATPVSSCSLGIGQFRNTVEDTLQGMILDLERHAN